jgi:hypothetical protein
LVIIDVKSFIECLLHLCMIVVICICVWSNTPVCLTYSLPLYPTKAYYSSTLIMKLKYFNIFWHKTLKFWFYGFSPMWTLFTRWESVMLRNPIIILPKTKEENEVIRRETEQYLSRCWINHQIIIRRSGQSNILHDYDRMHIPNFVSSVLQYP